VDVPAEVVDGEPPLKKKAILFHYLKLVARGIFLLFNLWWWARTIKW
jgi:hypothetical protein